MARFCRSRPERIPPDASARALDYPTLAEINAHVRTKIAGYKIPRELLLVDEVVRTPAGKPDYRWARAQVAAAFR